MKNIVIYKQQCHLYFNIVSQISHAFNLTRVTKTQQREKVTRIQATQVEMCEERKKRF